MASVAAVQTRILTRQAKAGGYDVYRAGLEWGLADLGVAEGSTDLARLVPPDAQRLEDAQATSNGTDIDALPGDGGGSEPVGPRAPKLPPVARSMDAREFTLAALDSEGAHVIEEEPGVYAVRGRDFRERICFEPRPDDERQLVLYAPHTPAFQRLVRRAIASGVHNIEDADVNAGLQCEKLAAQWVDSIGAALRETWVTAVTRSFAGTALVRVRATVARDRYEQLVPCACDAQVHRQVIKGDRGLVPIERIIRDPASVGIDTTKLREIGERDEALAAFARFYAKHREHAMQAAGDDEKRQKLDDAFTARFDMILAGLEGKIHRDATIRVHYGYAEGGDYVSEITVRPSTGEILGAPQTDVCARSGQHAPTECLGTCDASGAKVLKHLLFRSEFSARAAQPEFTERCRLSGKRALADELEASAVTGKRVASVLLKESPVSGARAEPEHFGVCAFTGAEVLKSELAISDLSRQPYRVDQQACSAVSGKTGHAREFTTCHETGELITLNEAETCEITGRQVRRGVLQRCAVSGKRALPTLFATCQASGTRVLETLLVTSSVSEARFMPEEALQSATGKFCLPAEAETCQWSGRKVHPDDLRTCALTGLRIHAEYATPQSPPRLRPLVEMLDGVRHNADHDAMWEKIAERMTRVKGGTCRIEAATFSPSKQRLAACAESKTMLGLRVRRVGAIYDLLDDAIVGRLAKGRRNGGGWIGRLIRYPRDLSGRLSL